MAAEAYTTSYYHSEPVPVSEPLSLSMLISNHIWSYAIFGKDFKTVYELCEVHLQPANSGGSALSEQVDHLLHNHGLHQKKFDKVVVGVINHQFTMVPDAYAGDGHTRDYLAFTTGHTAMRINHQHHVQGLLFGYSLPDDLQAVIEKTFANAFIRHSGAVNIYLLSSQHSLKDAQLFLNLHDGQVELVARNSKGLCFYNVFDYQNNEDVLYYLLFMMEQYELNPLTSKVVIAAGREVTDELMKTIKKYIKQVALAVNAPSVQMPGVFASLPQHYFFTLLNQPLCEL